ncbi:ABC transporter permease [uncultured Devosia sp.]|uniref:ABC transporter permease n=1 Tax=uncultured Devosia sp. TaxID=211434 RepID=UPI0035CB754E
MSEIATQAATALPPADWLSPMNRRRLSIFRANRRGHWSWWIFLVLFVVTLGAELLANDRPILVSYKGELLLPAFVDYPESKFGGFLAITNYRDEFIAGEIAANGWAVWPLVRFSYNTVDGATPHSGAVAPSWLMSRDELCAGYPLLADDPDCNWGNYHWLGTDDRSRDVLARLIYGFRISILFGLVLTIFSSAIGVAAGAVQGYFGGWTDLLFQRFIEIWTSIPALYLLLIISSVIAPSFWVLLGILLLFSWVSLVGIVRAEFLRGRNFEYITAARALGVSNLTIMWRHLLPNAMVATLTFIPFILSGSVATLTSLDFLGFGLPVGSPSLGELLAQGKNNLQAPWLGLTGFFTIAIMMTLLVFIGEGVRDAFDPRKTPV